jgi:rod shape-determining protein MreD
MSPWIVRVPPVLLAAVVIHSALAPNVRVFGISFDIMLLLAIASGIAGGAEKGAAVGFVCGLLADCFLQTPFGLSALVYALVGYGVGVFQTGVLHSSWWIPAITAAVSSALGILGYVALGVVVGQDHLLSTRVMQVIVVVALLHAVLAPPTVRLMRWALAESSTRTLIAR